ncbi:MAG: 16S rRNA (cytidine(1402)-2'-O)-methyltransferase [Candidatus Caldatribacteriota bacterium]
MGKIILLNTPIGNLNDLTPRVLEALRTGEYFAVEDTRVFKELLNHSGISLEGKKIWSFNDHAEAHQINHFCDLVLGGSDLYLASDAGSPMISDPAYPLVSAAIEKGIEIESYSGVSSPIMALELSGLPPIPFHFHGFLPREEKKKYTEFENLSHGTHIFFEAPTRIEETLSVLSKVSAELDVCVVRELSKKFQQVIRFKNHDYQNVKDELTVKGEFVLLVHSKNKSSSVASDELRKLAGELLEKNSAKTLSKLLGHILNRPSKEIYQELNRKND